MKETRKNHLADFVHLHGLFLILDVHADNASDLNMDKQ